MKIGLICSEGGHLTEMLSLIEAFSGHEIFFVTYHSSRVEELESYYQVYALDDIGTNILHMLRSWPIARRILRTELPDALVSTGSEIALPFFVLAKLRGIRTIFIESYCRIHTASVTGKLLYPLVDVFFVQWPQMLAIYGAKARYAGGLL